MTNHYDFEGRVALVTGGASGIGAATVERLRAGGADVHIFDLVNGEDLRAIAFAIGVESLAVGVVVGSAVVARAGAGILCASAVLTAAGAALTWSRRAHANVLL